MPDIWAVCRARCAGYRELRQESRCTRRIPPSRPARRCRGCGLWQPLVRHHHDGSPPSRPRGVPYPSSTGRPTRRRATGSNGWPVDGSPAPPSPLVARCWCSLPCASWIGRSAGQAIADRRNDMRRRDSRRRSRIDMARWRHTPAEDVTHVRFDHSLRALTAAKSGSVRSADQASCRAARRAGVLDDAQHTVKQAAPRWAKRLTTTVRTSSTASMISRTPTSSAQPVGGSPTSSRSRRCGPRSPNSFTTEAMHGTDRSTRPPGGPNGCSGPVAYEAKDACVHPSRIHISATSASTHELTCDQQPVSVHHGSSKDPSTTPTSSATARLAFAAGLVCPREVRQRRLPGVPV